MLIDNAICVNLHLFRFFGIIAAALTVFAETIKFNMTSGDLEAGHRFFRGREIELAGDVHDFSAPCT
jgi:hypothetical protein